MRLTNIKGTGRDEIVPVHTVRGARTFDTIELWEEDWMALVRLPPDRLAAWFGEWHCGFPPTLQS